MSEVWLPIQETSGKYKVSNLGRVKHSRLNRVLHGCITKDGYVSVTLRCDNGNRTFLVHRLVAQEFIPNNNNAYNCINHRDENKTNNHSSNLEWCDRSYNNSYGTRNERGSNSRKKIICQYDKSDNLISVFDSVLEAEEKTGIKRSCIASCARGLWSTSGGFRWKYKNNIDKKENDLCQNI